MAKRVAFQSLLPKLRLASTFWSERRLSFPGEAWVTRVYRRASAPYWLETSIGSMPLPFVLLILAPSMSRTMPWRYTVRNGTSPIISIPMNTIRATQWKMIS